MPVRTKVQHAAFFDTLCFMNPEGSTYGEGAAKADIPVNDKFG